MSTILKKRNDLERLREGLIIGASNTVHFMNTSELVLDYLDYNFKDVESAIGFYDYVELLPKEAYNEFIDKDGTNRLSSYGAVEKMNRYFYDICKKNNILVTASSARKIIFL